MSTIAEKSSPQRIKDSKTKNQKTVNQLDQINKKNQEKEFSVAAMMIEKEDNDDVSNLSSRNRD